MSRHIVIIGAGIFGAASALEFCKRGERVTLIDAGKIPNPFAESTDVSKAVRIDYGNDEFYVSEMERALEAWRAWNDEFGDALFHETGAMFISREPMREGSFEYESFTTLTSRGHDLTRLNARAIEAQSALRGFVDGYFNPMGGWAESARVVERLVQSARNLGADIRENVRASQIRIDGARATGIMIDDDVIEADAFVIATGGWISSLVPEIASCFRMSAQPVFHVACDGDVQLPVFGADIAITGWYGFPAHRDGYVKVANHGAGRAMKSESIDRDVTEEEKSRLRDFLRDALPVLANAPLVKSRVCVYCDTFDGHFFIAPHPDVANLVVATGGSGHAFKFAPRVGEWIARALEHDVIDRFRWRTDADASMFVRR